MKKILITRRLLRSCEDKAKELFDANFNLNDELYSQKKLIEMSTGCDGILSALTDKLDAETINQLPESVKIISNFAVGFGNIDLEAAKKRGIAVTNTPDVLTDATAEIGVLLILGACRRASEGIEKAREGGWVWSADMLIGKQLTGTRLGILGMGRIGQKIAKIAKSLGMIIHYHNRSKLSEEKEQGATYHDSLNDLMKVSDVLSVCCPASKETINLINKEGRLTIDTLKWNGLAKKAGMETEDVISEFKIENLNRPNKAIIYPFSFLLILIFGYNNFRRKLE